MHVLDQFIHAAALKQVLGQRKLVRFLGTTLTARYRDCREQRVASAAGAVLEYLENPQA